MAALVGGLISLVLGIIGIIIFWVYVVFWSPPEVIEELFIAGIFITILNYFIWWVANKLFPFEKHEKK